MNKYELTAEQISANWDKFLYIIRDDFGPDRSEALLEFYKKFEDRFILLPASTMNHYHNCIPGGYIDHVLRVRECAIKLHTLWQGMGADVSTYTLKELIFVALHHDLGKFGTFEHESYRPNPSDWHVKNQGAIYEINNKMAFMNVPDRGLFLLQSMGIELTENEWLGIKLHDGLYDDGNEYYFMAQRPETKLRTHLPILIHHADHMAARIEYEKWMNIESPLEKKHPTTQNKFRPQNSNKGRGVVVGGNINKSTFNKFFED